MRLSQEIIMFKLLIAGAVIVAGISAYKLWKAKKAVTGASVLAEAQAEVKDAVAAVKPAVVAAVEKVVTKQ